jgi:hypothetical protein
MTAQPDGQQPGERKLSGGAIASLTGAGWNAAQPGTDRWRCWWSAEMAEWRMSAPSTRTSSGSHARVWAPHLAADARDGMGAAGCGAAGAVVDLDLIRWT